MLKIYFVKIKNFFYEIELKRWDIYKYILNSENRLKVEVFKEIGFFNFENLKT